MNAGNRGARLAFCGPQADKAHRQAGAEVQKALGQGDFGAAAQDTDLGEGQKGDQQAVDALRAGKKLQNEDLAELAGVFGHNASGGLAAHAYAHGRADTGKKRRQNGSQQSQTNTKLFHT